VRAAAGREIVILDVDEPQRSGPAGLLAHTHRRGFFSGGESDRHRTVFPHHAVGISLGFANFIGSDLSREIDGRRQLPHVETLGAHAEEAIERRRQHVLPGVLLHVIEPPRPVDGAADHLAWFQGAAHDVSDGPVFTIDHVGYRHSA
jgi:hypothetical protein